MKKQLIRLSDIARLTGFSVATVSRALHEHPSINKKTKQKIQKVAEMMAYRPNKFAVSLKNQRSNILGLIVPNVRHSFFGKIVDEIVNTASLQGFDILLKESAFASEYECVKKMLLNGVDGVLISFRSDSTEAQKIVENYRNDIPIIAFDEVDKSLTIPKFVVNDRKGAYEAVEFLIQKRSCKNIAHLRGAMKSFIGKMRYRGYEDALQSNHFPINKEFIKNCEKGSFDEGYQLTLELMKLKKRPDAIFAVTDIVALGAIKALKEQNIKIPEQVSVIGFSDSYMAEIIDPKLTTVKQAYKEMVKSATEYLIQIIDQPENKFFTKVFDTELIVRET